MLLGEIVVVGRDHPALADRQVLVREEAETAGEAQPAALLPLPGAARRMRRVLDHRQATPFGDLVNRFHVAREAAVVQDDDRLRARPDRSLEVGRVEIQVVRAENVAEDRGRSGVRDRVCGGDEVERWQHDLVARGAPRSEQRQMQRGRPVGDGEGMLAPRRTRRKPPRMRAPSAPCSTSPRRSPRPRPREARRRRGRPRVERPRDRARL